MFLGGLLSKLRLTASFVGLLVVKVLLKNMFNIEWSGRFCCLKCRLSGNTVHLTVRGELVEPPATHEEPFDKLRANGISLKRTVLG